MNSSLFDQLSLTLQQAGSDAAVGQLCEQLHNQGEFNALFYALLLQKRHQLNINPIPTGSADELPTELHESYEDAIKEAARRVGQLHLDAGNIPNAWVYFRMIGEPAPIRAALEASNPAEDEDIQSLIQVALYQGVHPIKGFDWVLTRYGTCNAITTIGSGELPMSPEERQLCIRALVRTLYGDLRERLAGEIAAKWGSAPSVADAPPNTAGVVQSLITDRDWLFAEDAYHIDTSHLSSVVQMAMTLDACAELGLARELCAYGAKLTGRFMGQDEPPFENGYADYGIYLAILAGEKVEEGVAHFTKKLHSDDPDGDDTGTYPAEVLVNLLLKLNRGNEAIEVARKHLTGAERQGRQLTCPNLNELCQKFKAYQTLADVAKELNDPVFYLAGLLAAKRA
jgi:hypothetical protein